MRTSQASSLQIGMSGLRREGRAVLVDVELLGGDERPVLTLALEKLGTVVVPGVVAYRSTAYALTIPFLEKVFARVREFSEKHANKIDALRAGADDSSAISGAGR